MVDTNKFSPEEAAVFGAAVKKSEEMIEKKAKNVSWLMTGVIIVLFIGFITMLAMVGTLIVDSFHINSTTYKEYTERTNQLEKNQQIIIDLQKQIQELLKKK